MNTAEPQMNGLLSMKWEHVSIKVANSHAFVSEGSWGTEQDHLRTNGLTVLIWRQCSFNVLFWNQRENSTSFSSWLYSSVLSVLVGGRLALGFVWTLISVCSHSKSANTLKISSTCKSTPLLTDSAVVDIVHSPAPFPLTLTYTRVLALNPK